MAAQPWSSSCDAFCCAGANGVAAIQQEGLSERGPEAREVGSNIRKVGLARTPVAGSVGTQLDLPPPAIAVRNLVSLVICKCMPTCANLHRSFRSARLLTTEARHGHACNAQWHELLVAHALQIINSCGQCDPAAQQLLHAYLFKGQQRPHAQDHYQKMHSTMPTLIMHCAYIKHGTYRA